MARSRAASGLLVAAVALAGFLAGHAWPAGNRTAEATGGSPTLTWEPIDNRRLPGTTYRSPIPGGWLLTKNSNDTGITFVPDPRHEWDGSSLP